MRNNSKNTTRGWASPERYIQGPGEFKNIKHFTDKFGKRVVAFIDQFLFKEYTEKLKGYYQEEGYFLYTIDFDTGVTTKEIERRKEEVSKQNAEVVLALGGGQTIDIANAVATSLRIPSVIVPTIAATDAPTSSLTVVYDDNGEFQEDLFFDFGPRLVLVDSQIIADAPVRFLVSGMGDALATIIEAVPNHACDGLNSVYKNDGGYRHTIAAKVIAEVCYETLMRDGLKAKIACEHNKVSVALENIIEANILLSGLGFENNGTAGAHAINHGMTSLPESSKTYHGERVAFGCVVQLVLENASNEKIDEVYRFCLDVGLPVCLSDLQVPNTKENMQKIAEASIHSGWANMPFEVTVDMVDAAIAAADEIGERYKQQYTNNLLV